ncbi:hypothetical protein KKC17_04110 [Patescibacteria group bacterium]|nr:hypothetical protein [Patescibacteria group bacterium]
MDELNNQQLKLGYWYIKHKETLQAGIFGVVGAGLVLLLVYAGWQITSLLLNWKNEELMLKQLVESRVETYDYNQRHAPEEIAVGYKAAVPAGVGRYDLVVAIRNNNANWAITDFSYSLLVEGQEFKGTNFLLPQEDKYLIIPQVELKYRPSQFDLEITNLSWRRIRENNSYAWSNFSVKNEKFEQLFAEGDGQASSSLKFSLMNLSAYGYLQVPVNAILLRGNEVVAVARQILPELISGQTKEMEFYWPGQVIYADKLLIKPEVNIFRSDSILTF